MELVAIGSLIGAKIAAAGAAVAATAAAHPILFTLGAASAIAGATTGIVSGVQANSAAKRQADQMRMQMEAERTQFAFEEEERQKRLRRTLSMQNAIFGGSNVDLSTGSPSIIAGDTFNEAERQRNQAGLFSDTRVSLLGAQANDAMSAGRLSMTKGFLGAGQSLLNFGVGMGQLGSVPKNPAVKVEPLGPVFAPNGGIK